MTQIKIFQPETYPKNIVEVRNEIMNFSDDTKNEIIHEEYLRDYASSKLWDLDSEFGKIHNRLMNYMEESANRTEMHNRWRFKKKCFCLTMNLNIFNNYFRVFKV